jgi:hypothetical protein
VSDDPLERVRAGLKAAWINEGGEVIVHHPGLGTVPIAKQELGGLLGFTWEMVDWLRNTQTSGVYATRDYDRKMRGRLDEVADRIEALLPPRTP